MKAAATIRQMLLWPLLLAYILAGCAATPPVPSAAAPDVQAEQARAAAAQGDYATAAQRLVRLWSLARNCRSLQRRRS